MVVNDLLGHSGRVIGRNGKPQVLIGAPNTTFVLIYGNRNFLKQSPTKDTRLLKGCKQNQDRYTL